VAADGRHRSGARIRGSLCLGRDGCSCRDAVVITVFKLSSMRTFWVLSDSAVVRCTLSPGPAGPAAETQPPMCNHMVYFVELSQLDHRCSSGVIT